MSTYQKLSFPYLHDHHTHTFFYGLLSKCPSLADVHDKDTALTMLRSLRSEFTVVTGWYSSRYVFSQAELESLPPILICQVSLHTFSANKRGLEFIARYDHTIAAHLFDQEWVERHLPSIFECIMGLFPFDGAVITAFMHKLLSLGIYSADDMLAPHDEAVVFSQTTAMKGRIACWVSPDVWNRLSPENRKHVSGIKLFTDGANGAYSAALEHPYDNGSHGILLHDDDELPALFEEARRMSAACAVHAIGDRAIAQTLASYERYVKEFRPFSLFRIEHCQFITKTQAMKARDLGITLSMQPNFNSDSVDYAGRLARCYIEGNDPFRMLIDECGFVPGKDLIFGSDGMPHGLKPALEAVLFPSYEGQRLTVEEFRAGYCLQNGAGDELTVTVDHDTRTVNMEAKQ